MKRNQANYVFITISTLLLIALQLTTLNGAELQIAPAKNGKSFSYSFSLDKVDKLAGMKLSITFPKDQLVFESATKDKTFKSFMHVVNDKNPGKLTIVMASAKGVSGSNLPIFEMNFTTKQALHPPANSSITPVECQLMSESLQEITCSTSAYAISSTTH